MISLLSIGLYLLSTLSLTIYLCYHFTKYRKPFQFAVYINTAIVILVYTLQFWGIRDFPEMLWLVNFFYIVYAALAVLIIILEFRIGNPFICFMLPWFILFVSGNLFVLLLFYIGNINLFEWLSHLTFFLLLCAMWFYNIRLLMRNWFARQQENKMLRVKTQMDRESMSHMKEQNERVRILRHEINHHLGALQILLEENEYPQAVHYLDKLVSMNTDSGAEYSANPLLNAILNEIFAQAENSGITVSHRILLPRDIPVDEIDLSSVVMNLLENALEACVAVPRGVARFIHCKMYLEKGYLFIECENSKIGNTIEKRGIFPTSKEQKEGHGYGLRIIRQAVENSDGLLDISYTETTFKVIATLKLNPNCAFEPEAPTGTY